MTRKTMVFAAAAAVSACAMADFVERPSGIKIGERMTLRPYVSLSASYDSNVGGRHEADSNTGDVCWRINPRLGLNYKADTWSLLLNIHYSYNAYSKHEYSGQHNQHSYGETLRWNWTNAAKNDRGWTLMLSETLQQVTMADDMAYGDGSSYTADRRQLTIDAAAQRRFNEHWHGDVLGNYYFLEYDNDVKNPTRSALYGWQRWSGTLEGGYAPSRWTDIIAQIGYQGYRQENVAWTGLSRDSQGYMAQIGLGSYATEKISYRLLGGWSRFEYANADDTADGFIYTLTGNWRITDTLHTMAIASSYYQPSERETATRTRVDYVSWGIGKSLVRGKVTTSLDLTYRHEAHTRTSSASSHTAYDDYDLDIASARASINYSINRFFGCFLSGEYLRSWNSESDSRNGYLDYDRWRITLGVSLSY